MLPFLSWVLREKRQRSEARVLNCTMVIDCRRLHVNMGKFLNVNSLQFDKEMTCVYVQMERKDSRRGDRREGVAEEGVIKTWLPPTAWTGLASKLFFLLGR